MKGLDLVFYVSVCTDTTKPIVGTIGFTLKTVFSLPVKQALLLLFFELCSVEDAANYRDELREIAPHSLLKCLSDATTLGIRVQVRCVYIEGQSQPSKGRYFFAYRIRITNNSERPVQLLRRHWIITDAHGKIENVWGIGVIGEPPSIVQAAAIRGCCF
ncbi:uncharacterized protein LOC133806303 [Humulus lupulus]|uniref:uncharacterized protein LOC133806303 n=1 Tax=Humulus lupulus TaxID=3486 RepID=UPI002B41650C|nr:uncharacterized protein LOC133806303 [Humulus lupulus]